jgi:cell division protein FtsI/penicillin-binding protein 2
MAMVAAAVAHPAGNVMRPKIEVDQQPDALSQAMSAESAAQLRGMLAGVVNRGTASGAFAAVRGKLTAGGKTGTAQRLVPVIDPKTEEPVMIRDRKGVEHVKKQFRIDSWFVGFAPVENPQVAIAVVVEGGGYGGRTAAPIAASLLARAQALGLMNPPAPAPTAKK